MNLAVAWLTCIEMIQERLVFQSQNNVSVRGPSGDLEAQVEEGYTG